MSDKQYSLPAIAQAIKEHVAEHGFMDSVTSAILRDGLDSRLKQFLEDQGYKNVRILPDGIICTSRYIFTTGVLINPNWSSYEKRFCYENHALAEKIASEMVSVEDFLSNPIPGYTAVK